MQATASEALQAVERACLKSHVFVLNAQQLGGLALVVQWEMEGDRRQSFVDALAEQTIYLDEASAETLAGPWPGELTGSLHVTLEHEGRDERITIPSVPG
jgi:hypothetical protein